MFGLFCKRLGRFQSACYILVKVNVSSAGLNVVMESHLLQYLF